MGGEDSPITTRVKVDLDFADYEERSEHYQIIFREEVATILGIDKERVVIANVWSGESTMFKFYVTNDPWAMAGSANTPRARRSATARAAPSTARDTGASGASRMIRDSAASLRSRPQRSEAAASGGDLEDQDRRARQSVRELR